MLATFLYLFLTEKSCNKSFINQLTLVILEEYWPLVFLVWGLRYSIDMYTAMPMAKIFMFLSCIWLIRYMYCYLLFLERQVDNSGVSFFSLPTVMFFQVFPLHM